MKPRFLLGIAVIFFSGVMVGLFAYASAQKKFFSTRESDSKQVRQMGSFQYINPLLECDVAEGSIDARKENFHDDLEGFVDEVKKKRHLTDAAVYFRDLNNGPTFGVNLSGEFFPASLLKVPVMMVYYHWSESDPNLLSTKILYEGPKDFDVTPSIIPKEELVPGQSYTVTELIRRMIVYSDNQSLGLLTSRLPIEKIQDLFSMLGVSDNLLHDTEGKLTVKEYAGFFRILFNSSYLSRENSEQALMLLSSTDFNEGIVAGVPQAVQVAHKFGEAGMGDIERQLHDCGIVYFPNHPYLACIMTRGKDTETLKQSITDISRFIYQKIDEQY